MELAQHMKQLYWPKSRTEHYEEFERLLKTFQVKNLITLLHANTGIIAIAKIILRRIPLESS